MKSERELFNLAKNYVMLADGYDRFMPEYEMEEFKKEMDKIRNTVLEKGYSIDKFVEYQKLYKSLSVEEYYQFIKTLN